jgi:hypothetical protein
MGVLPAAVMPLPFLMAGAVALTPLPLSTLPAELQPVVRELQRHGFRVRLANPPVRGSYGLFQPRTRTLWVAPIAFELGIGPQTFLHEAVHAAQSCPSGTLTPIGWRLTLSPVVDREISGILTTRYHHGNRLLEQEAFGMQGQSEAPSLVVAALRQRCRSVRAPV